MEKGNRDYKRILVNNCAIIFMLVVAFFDTNNQKKLENNTLEKTKKLKSITEQIDQEWKESLDGKAKLANYYKHYGKYCELSESDKRLVDSYNKKELKKDSILKAEITQEDVKNFERFKLRNRGNWTPEKRQQNHIASIIMERVK